MITTKNINELANEIIIDAAIQDMYGDINKKDEITRKAAAFAKDLTMNNFVGNELDSSIVSCLSDLITGYQEGFKAARS